MDCLNRFDGAASKDWAGGSMITINVVQDIVCPWCRVGEHNLQAALDRWTGEPVTVRLHPYMLSPETPPEGVGYREYLTRKFGAAKLSAIFARLSALGDELGLPFNNDRIERLPNTARAHAMIAAVPDELQRPLLHAIQEAYFVEGRDVGSADVLAQIGQTVGLSAEVAREAAENSDQDAVLREYREALEGGITGVPTFIFNGRVPLVGAQPPDAILSIFSKLSTTETNA
jgi:predicted DsbA family dithiol-disulfide isomerase